MSLRVAQALLPLLLLIPTPAQESQPASRPGLTLTGLEADAPLRLAASATPEQLTLRVELKDGWHLYGRDTGNGQPVTVEIQKDSAFVAAGRLRAPMNDQGEIVGEAELTLPLRRAGTGDALRARIQFMVCDPLQCLPPMTVLVAGTVPTAAPTAAATPAVLLVAVASDARSTRIADFLRQRGFRPTVTTYAAVTKEQCDAHDVVIADSPYFKQAGGARKDAMRFPETATPMVAVGFLGSQVLVAQKVTMACGYI